MLSLRSLLFYLFLSSNCLLAGRSVAKGVSDSATINRIIHAAEGILNPDSAIVLYDSAFDESRRSGYNDGAFVAQITKGIKYFEKLDYKNYRKVSIEALPWAKKSSQPDAVAWCVNNIGEAYFYEGDYITANEYYYNALTELNKRTKTITHSTANIYNSLGLVNLRLNQKEKSLAFFNQAEEVSRIANLPYQLAISCENKGTYYLLENNPDSARKYFEMELVIGRQMGKVDLRAFAHAQLGKTCIESGDYEKGIQELNKAISLAQNRFHPPVIDAAFSMSQALIHLKRYAEAASILHWAHAETRDHNYKDRYITAYATLASLYKHMGQPALALSYMDTLLALKDSLTSTGKAHAINTLEIKYKTSEKDRQLAESRLLIERQQSKLARKNILIGSIAAGVCLLIILMMLRNRNMRNKQKLQEEQIKSLNQEHTITVLNARVEGEEKERTRLARELHDGIGGMLSAAMMRFSTVPRRAPAVAAEPAYKEAMTLLGEMGDEIRKTAHNLMPEILLKQTLPDAVSALCKTVTVDGTLKTECQCYGDFTRLTQEMKLNCYRIIQELLKNVVKHAGATIVLVQLMHHEHSLTITVEDNGAGFDTEKTNTGMGLQNVRARVHSLGGHYTIESEQGKGTTVYIEFEMMNADHAGSKKDKVTG
jgi:signal transduction histidine kinase